MTQRLKAYDLPESLYDYAMIPAPEETCDSLASIAEPETWDYQNSPQPHLKPILRNYLKYTYKRIAEEKKVSITNDDNFSCFNTGLITPNQEQIFMVFEKNNLADPNTPYWHFRNFASSGQREVNKFSKLPDMAHYFDDPSCLVYDTRKELRVNVEHIVEDNKTRFPTEIQTMNQIMLRNLVDGAINSAKEKVKRNYKVAIPQYYNSSIQLLLPVSFTGVKADLALVVERFPDFYRATTCLTLDMAYNNARQITRPDRDWLLP